MTSVAPTLEKERFLTLDGLRGVAAVCVLVTHCAPLFGFDPINAALAVDFFFCLSGFVIAHSYGSRLRNGMTAGQFMRIRTVRLYPLYLLGLTLAVAAALAGFRFDWEALSPSQLGITLPFALVMLPVFVSTFLFPFNAPTWSLFFEMVANAAYGVLHRFAEKPVWMAAGLALSGIGLSVFALHYGSADVGWQTDKRFVGGLFRVTYSFLAGIAVHAAHRRLRTRFLLSPWALAAILFMILLSSTSAGLQAAFQLICIVFVFPAIVYVGAGVTFTRYIPNLLKTLGASSYALYALHWPLYEIVDRGSLKIFDLPLERFAPWSGWLFLLLALSIAAAADSLFDRPVRRRITQLLQGSARRASIAAP